MRDVRELIERATDAVVHHDDDLCWSLMPAFINIVKEYLALTEDRRSRAMVHPAVSDNAHMRATRQERATSDLHPACPRCQDLLDPGAKWCNSCGCWVTLDGPRSSDLRSRSMQAAQRREDVEAARGTEA